jgi:hypothetical protein
VLCQNGTGVYGRLARLMRRQQIQHVRSVEVGVRMILTRRHVAIFGGRETLYYDTERFGTYLSGDFQRIEQVLEWRPRLGIRRTP